MPLSARYRAEVQWVRKRESQQRHQEIWNNQCKYYDKFNRDNERFKVWTSPQAYAESLQKYNEIEEQKKKVKEEEIARNKRDLELLEQKRQQEIAEKEEERKKKQYRSVNDTPVEFLKEIHDSISMAEESRRRREAEEKLYQHWRINNPTIRQCESRQRHSNLKLAWLDAQIEKQMAKEKEEKETKKLLEERDRQIKEEEEKEHEYRTQLEEKTKQMHEIINKQVKELKEKDAISELLKEEEAREIRRKDAYDRILREREEDQKRRLRQEQDLYNLNQYRLKIRRRTVMIQEELASERRVYERILAEQQHDEQQVQEKRATLQGAIQSAIACLQEQQRIEAKRQEYLSFIFDSEAKTMWERQERVWMQEQKARDDLFNDVMHTINLQIEEKIQQKIDQQKKLVEEKENVLQQIEQVDKELKDEREAIRIKQETRRTELDNMIHDKTLRQKELNAIERREQQMQLEKHLKEEERLRQEIAKIQLNNFTPAVPKRRIAW